MFRSCVVIGLVVACLAACSAGAESVRTRPVTAPIADPGVVLSDREIERLASDLEGTSVGAALVDRGVENLDVRAAQLLAQWPVEPGQRRLVVLLVVSTDGRVVIITDHDQSEKRVTTHRRRIIELVEKRVQGGRVAEGIKVGVAQLRKVVNTPTAGELAFDPRMLPKLDPEQKSVEAMILELSKHEAGVRVKRLYEITLDPVETLIVIAADEGQPESVRLRAFETLSFVADDRVLPIYARALAAEGGERLRHRAIVGFARAWPDKAPETLGLLIATSDDPQIRLTAAQALIEFAGPPGWLIVEQAVDAEPDEFVREKMERWLARVPR